MAAIDVYVTECSLGGGTWLYQVWADGKVYEQMTNYSGQPPLTFSQQMDMGNYFKEALTRD